MPKFYHYFFHSACPDCVVLLLLVFLLFSQISECLLCQARGDNSSTTFHHSVTLSSGGLFDQVCLCCPFIPPEALSLMAVSFCIKVTVFTYRQIIRKPNRSPGLWSCLGTPHLDVLTAPQVGYKFSQQLATSLSDPALCPMFWKVLMAPCMQALPLLSPAAPLV